MIAAHVPAEALHGGRDARGVHRRQGGLRVIGHRGETVIGDSWRASFASGGRTGQPSSLPRSGPQLKNFHGQALSRLKMSPAGVSSRRMAHGSSILEVPAALGGISASRPDDLVAVLLIAMVTAIIVCIAVLRFIARRELRRCAQPRNAFGGPHLSAAVFETPSRWLAVRSQNPQAVQAALGVQHPRACSWSDALATPFEPRLFISPPVKGWIVVMGCDLPDPSDDIDECFKFLT